MSDRPDSADPEQWALALLKATQRECPETPEGRVALIADWFRDAMAAALKARDGA